MQNVIMRSLYKISEEERVYAQASMQIMWEFEKNDAWYMNNHALN